MDHALKTFLSNFIQKRIGYTKEQADKEAENFYKKDYATLEPCLIFKSHWKNEERIKCTCKDEKCVTGIKHYEKNAVVLIDKYGNENLMYINKESKKELIEMFKSMKMK